MALRRTGAATLRDRPGNEATTVSDLVRVLCVATLGQGGFEEDGATYLHARLRDDATTVGDMAIVLITTFWRTDWFEEDR